MLPVQAQLLWSRRKKKGATRALQMDINFSIHFGILRGPLSGSQLGIHTAPSLSPREPQDPPQEAPKARLRGRPEAQVPLRAFNNRIWDRFCERVFEYLD